MIQRMLLLLALLAPAPGRADILFLDLNNSAKEVEAARKAAKKRGEQLVLLPPPLTAEETRDAEAAKTRLTEMRERYDEQCGDRYNARCEELSEQLDQAAPLQDRFKPEQLRELLKSRAASGKTFSSVVVSGHDGTGGIHGDNGDIRDDQIASIFASVPGQQDALRALHLWGCYTTSPGSLMLNWKKHFPNVSLITGYDGRAPLNSTPAGWHYLQGVLEKEDQLIQSGDANKLRRNLMAIRGVTGAGGVGAAVMACNDFANKQEAYDLGETVRRCESYGKEIRAKEGEFLCYRRAREESCANPPSDTSAGPVRKFYELLQKVSPCQELSDDGIFRAYSRDQAIRLNYFKSIQRNASTVHAQDLAALDALLARTNAPDSLRFTGLEKLSRRDLISNLEGLLKHLKNTPPGDRAVLRRFHIALTNIFVDLKAGCVPFNWTDPDKNVRSRCLSNFSAKQGKNPGPSNPLNPRDAGVRDRRMEQEDERERRRRQRMEEVQRMREESGQATPQQEEEGVATEIPDEATPPAEGGSAGQPPTWPQPQPRPELQPDRL